MDEIISLFLGVDQIQTDGTNQPLACCLSQLVFLTAQHGGCWVSIRGMLGSLLLFAVCTPSET